MPDLMVIVVVACFVRCFIKGHLPPLARKIAESISLCWRHAQPVGAPSSDQRPLSRGGNLPSAQSAGHCGLPPLVSPNAQPRELHSGLARPDWARPPLSQAVRTSARILVQSVSQCSCVRSATRALSQVQLLLGA